MAEARAGDPVEVFRKYVGRVTDELCSGRTHPIVVTAAAFARHVGMSGTAFAARLRAAGLGGNNNGGNGVAMPRPPTDEQVKAYLRNRDRCPDDDAERERARVELAAAEAARMAAAGRPGARVGDAQRAH